MLDTLSVSILDSGGVIQDGVTVYIFHDHTTGGTLSSFLYSNSNIILENKAHFRIKSRISTVITRLLTMYCE